MSGFNPEFMETRERGDEAVSKTAAFIDAIKTRNLSPAQMSVLRGMAGVIWESTQKTIFTGDDEQLQVPAEDTDELTETAKTVTPVDVDTPVSKPESTPDEPTTNETVQAPQTEAEQPERPVHQTHQASPNGGSPGGHPRNFLVWPPRRER